MRDRVAEFFHERTPRRALAIMVFLTALFLFRHLGALLAFFVMFERGLFFSAGALSRRFKWTRVQSLGVVLLGALVVVTLVVWLSAGQLARLVAEARDTLPERVAAIRQHPWFIELSHHLPDSEKLAQSAEAYMADVARSAAALGRIVLQALIGLVLAIVFFLDEEKIRSFRQGIKAGTLSDVLARWLEHLAEAVSLTVQLQLIVAGCNAVLTLPVLWLIGVPHVPALMLLIFVSGLIPVVGNLLSGGVLVVLAYQAKGWFGVIIFAVLTFVLHKIEAYFLNPRLTARHVPLPGFVLILSLVACEHLFGFVGLFISFPFLFVAGKLRAEFAAEDAADAAAPALAQGKER